MLVAPSPFPAKIVPRDDKKVARVKTEWETMEEVLDEDLQWKVLPAGLIWKDYKPVDAL
jgi:hypothetical protein